MKTIEEKARAYDESLERAKSEYRAHKSFNGFCEMLARIFPELKESEDEDEDDRIRKAIILSIKDNKTLVSMNGFSKNDMTAWLEKQGEQKSADTCDSLIIKSKEFPASEKRDFGYFSESGDKVEPKFKVGDWITDGYIHCKISDVLDDRYIVDTKFAKRSAIQFKHENNYHLWSIKDAKSGDVLATDSWLYVFKYTNNNAIIQFHCTCPINGKPYKWCFLSDNSYLDIYVDANIHPATKEQRDLLLQKMHEAGYTFDFEKKELKELKFKVGDEIITENEESLTITRIDEDGYWSNDLFICDFDCESIWDLVEQKPYGQRKECLDCQFNYAGECKGSCAMKRNELESTWSEEDEEHLNSIISDIKTDMGAYPRSQEVIDIYNDDISFLKSLRDRVQPQPKQEWSEEDEIKIKSIIAFLKSPSLCAMDGNKGIIDANIKYLKSLKGRVQPQSQWKPSDEQIKAIRLARSFVVDDFDENPTLSEILMGLEEQLKKLKGE